MLVTVNYALFPLKIQNLIKIWYFSLNYSSALSIIIEYVWQILKRCHYWDFKRQMMDHIAHDRMRFLGYFSDVNITIFNM